MRTRDSFVGVLTAVLMIAASVPWVSAAPAPTLPYDVMAFGPPGSIRVSIEGTLAAVGLTTDEDWGDGPIDGVALYDITVPSAPTTLGVYPTGAMPWEIQLEGDTLYEARDGLGLVIWDVTDPANASEIGSAPCDADFALHVEGDVAYVGDWSPAVVYAIETSVPTNPTILDSIGVGPGNLSALGASGTVVFAGGRNGGEFTTIDASDPSNLTTMSAIPADSIRLVPVGDKVYTADYVDGLAVYDVSNPASVSLETTRANPHDGWSIDAVGSQVFLGAGGPVVAVYDITSPSSPVEQRRMPTGVTVRDITVQGSYAWMAGEAAGTLVARLPTTVGLDVVQGVAGADRYTTAIAASREAFPYGGVHAVVIATGRSWPDALGGSALARRAGGPILLTPQDSLPPAVLAEIRRLGAEEAYILGGTGAVGGAVETALLSELGAGNVTRLGGSDRYATSELIADEAVSFSPRLLFVATGRSFPDALAASPLAFIVRASVVLTEPDLMRSSTASLVAALAPDEVVVLGGTNAVSDTVVGQLEGIVGAGHVTRIGGTTRYDTAARVAQFGIDTWALCPDNMALAVGSNFPDALSGGPLQGSQQSVLLLTDGSTLSPETAAKITQHAADIGRVRFLGGTAGISQPVRDDVTALLP